MTVGLQFELISEHATSENCRKVDGIRRRYEGKNRRAVVEAGPKTASQSRVTATIPARLKPSLGPNHSTLRQPRFLNRLRRGVAYPTCGAGGRSSYVHIPAREVPKR
jgi:hypothetical protein